MVDPRREPDGALALQAGPMTLGGSRRSSLFFVPHRRQEAIPMREVSAEKPLFAVDSRATSPERAPPRLPYKQEVACSSQAPPTRRNACKTGPFAPSAPPGARPSAAQFVPFVPAHPARRGSRPRRRSAGPRRAPRSRAVRPHRQHRQVPELAADVDRRPPFVQEQRRERVPQVLAALVGVAAASSAGAQTRVIHCS